MTLNRVEIILWAWAGLASWAAVVMFILEVIKFGQGSKADYEIKFCQGQIKHDL